MNPADSTPAYRLDGKALALARQLHEYSQEVGKEYNTLSEHINKYSRELLQDFDIKHDEPFRRLFTALAKELCIPIEELHKFRLDVTYLEDHGLAFMQQGQMESVDPKTPPKLDLPFDGYT